MKDSKRLLATRREILGSAAVLALVTVPGAAALAAEPPAAEPSTSPAQAGRIDGTGALALVLSSPMPSDAIWFVQSWA